MEDTLIPAGAAGADDTRAVGDELMALIARLYPLGRSL